MTREESMSVFNILSANWKFLDFSDPTVAGVWFEAFKAFDVAEVRQGFLDATRKINHTPVVADVLELVEAVHGGNRRRAEEQNARRVFSDAVRCRSCNDHGYQTIIYPDGTEAVRPCGCVTGTEMWGENVFGMINEGMPAWKVDLLFNHKKPSDYKLIRVSKRHVPTGQKYRSKDGRDLDILKVAYVPYQASGRPKEEIYFMYAERS